MTKTLLQHAAELNEHPGVQAADVVNGVVKVALKGGTGVYALRTMESVERFREEFLGPVTDEETPS